MVLINLFAEQEQRRRCREQAWGYRAGKIRVGQIEKGALTYIHPHGLQPSRLLCPQDFSGKNTGVGCHFLLQGISDPGIEPISLKCPECKQVLYHQCLLGTYIYTFPCVYICQYIQIDSGKLLYNTGNSAQGSGL